jgi:radical SAM protein with 4Fe4S-binding SPASM domain
MNRRAATSRPESAHAPRGERSVASAAVPKVWETESVPRKDSGVFCMAPWTSLSIHPDGGVRPCCVAEKGNATLGDLHRSTLSEIWNSEDLRGIRLNMLRGERSPQCAPCYRLESAGCTSRRNEMNSHFGRHARRVRQTLSDGTVESLDLTYLDVRFSSVCNLKCRYCRLELSSAWYSDHMALGLGPDEPAVLTPTDTPEQLWRQIEPLIPRLERVYFSGGEPLMSPQTFRLMEALVRAGRTDVALHFNTNFTFPSGGTEAMELWKRFDSVLVGASLDAMGERGEYIRKNLRWSDVVSHRERMRRVCPNVTFFINPTISVWNLLHLPDFHWDWIKRGFISPEDVTFNMLTLPAEFSVQVLPREIKERAAGVYESHVRRLAAEYGPYARKAAERFQEIIRFVFAADDSARLNDFRAAARRLDTVRGESVEKVFPELSEIFRGH